MIARLIENQEVCIREHGTNQGNSHRLTAAQDAGRRICFKVAQVIALKFIAESLVYVPVIYYGMKSSGAVLPDSIRASASSVCFTPAKSATVEPSGCTTCWAR